MEDFKKVCEVIACNIRVKYKGDTILRRTLVTDFKFTTYCYVPIQT